MELWGIFYRYYPVRNTLAKINFMPVYSILFIKKFYQPSQFNAE